MWKLIARISILISCLFLLALISPANTESAQSKWHRRCHGSGYLPCDYCHGSGYSYTGFTCEHCHGTGKHKCGRCNGSGVLTSFLRVHKV